MEDRQKTASQLSDYEVECCVNDVIVTEAAIKNVTEAALKNMVKITEQLSDYDLEKLKNLYHDKRVKNAEQLSELITFANTFDDRLVFVKDIIGFYLDMANRCGIPPKDIRFSIFDILSNLGSVPTANIKICAEMEAKKGETE